MWSGQLIVDIDEMLFQFPDAAPSPSIYRVRGILRSTSNEVYDPMVIAIGPLHHGKGHLKDMQNLKMRYLKNLVGWSSVGSYVNAIRGMEQDARAFYEEKIELEPDEFVQMLLLDGIFIIEFLRQYDLGIPISGFGHVVTLILRDLMLFENQIPLFVLEELFEVSKNNNNTRKKLSDLIWPFLSGSPAPDIASSGAKHLLALVHCARTSSFAQILSSQVGCNDKVENFSKKKKNDKVENIRSASELKEAGAVFKKAKNDKTRTNSWLDIRFENKTLYFPELEISDVTESLLKNMITYEYYLPSDKPRYITDYAFFLHCLVHSSKDAELLRRMGIISNLLGGDARVYEVIERLGTNAQPSEKFLYLEVFRSVNCHCKLKSNRWLAVLRRNHFNNPWTAISLVAAAVLLSVGIVQMVYAILSYYK